MDYTFCSSTTRSSPMSENERIILKLYEVAEVQNTGASLQPNA